MSHFMNRRRFLQASAAGCMAGIVCAGESSAQRPTPGRLVLNDDGHVFLFLSDDLDKDDLRRYLESYCREGVGTVAYCVGDMSWPTFHPTKIGVHYSKLSTGGDLKRARGYKNLDNFASEPGGYFGTVFRILRELGKTTLASFRMNDAHFTSTDSPHVSEFWKQHAKRALGPEYGYYGGCLNYAVDEVRDHFFERLMEFADLYPDVDGFELDAMRSPFFFPPGEGEKHAPLFTELIRRIKTALAERAARLKRPPYLLSINVPLTPELALECGLDVPAWDSEGLVDYVSAGTYHGYMNHPMEKWKKALPKGTPVYAYIGCSPQTGRYLGLEEYRAAAANAYGAGADGIYLFNYPCLYELAMQVPRDREHVKMALEDMRAYGQQDFSRVAQALDEINRPDALAGKNKRFLFYSETGSYRHHALDAASVKRADNAPVEAVFRCYEDYATASAITLRFILEHVTRTEQFDICLNGRKIEPGAMQIRYAANGRDTRIHSVTRGPYQEYEIPLGKDWMVRGENKLEVTPRRLDSDLPGKIYLFEMELDVSYAT